MTSLPPELAPWAEVLAGFAPDLVEVVGQMARRLDLLVGRVRARPRPRGDDPEGYDGLERRGPYDRLLLSEWALAEELPEEFDRRAVSGEHAFLRLDRRDRARGARSLVLFDAGPDNLGGPRVVQLAALVVLWRRALAGKAELRWAVLQGGAAATTVDRTTVLAFLSGRSARPATPEDLRRCRAEAGDIDEVWVVGASVPLAAEAGPAALHLALADVVEPDVHAVDVRLSRGGATLGEARLDLPPPPLARKLLVEPFAPPAAAPSRTPRPGPPPDAHPKWQPFPRGMREPWLVRFIPETQQLLVCMADKRALLWKFEDGKPRSPKPKVRELPGEPLIAVGRWRQQLITMALTAEGQIRPWDASPLAAPAGGPPRPRGHPPSDDGHRGPIGTLVRSDDLVAFTDAAHDLFVLLPGDRRTLLRAGGDVRLLFRVETGLFAVADRDAGAQLVRIDRSGIVPVGRLPGGTFTLAGWRAWNGPPRALVVRTEDGTVTCAMVDVSGERVVLRPHSAGPVSLDPDQRLLGAVLDGPGFAPITWDRHRGVVRHHGTGITVTPARTPHSLTVTPSGKSLAWCTAEGLLEVWSLETGDPVLLRYAP